MDEPTKPLERLSVPELDRILGIPFKVLDDGFIRVVDYMGSDASIVQAARVSYGAGTKKVHEDRGLIRYLMRHRHTTPFEMCEIKLHVRVPMDCWRQWIRHRMACLSGETELYFDLPHAMRNTRPHLYKIRIDDLWKRFQPTRNTQRPDKQRNPHFRRDRVQAMQLRQINEESLLVQHTSVVDVRRSGLKEVFRMALADGKKIECSADHRFYFEHGWKSLAEATGLHQVGGMAVWAQGDYRLFVNGVMLEAPELYKNKEWLDAQYNVLKRRIADIADCCGVSYHTIRKWLAVHSLQHAKGGRSKAPWNKDKTYRLGSREMSEAWKAANRAARSGPASNFWRGGVTSRRSSIGRWTTQIARRIHERNCWTCQLCGKRVSLLHCHHIVPVWADESLALDEKNLTSLCIPCHKKVRGRELEYVEALGGPPVKASWQPRPRKAWNKLTAARLVSIVSFEYVGIKETYDLEVGGPHHNFIANGIVTHNSVNEYSTRYSVAIDAAQRTSPSEWRLQTAGNRQGSEGCLDDSRGAALTAREGELLQVSKDIYHERLNAGVAREQARKDLPLSTYTEAYWKIDLHNLLHFLALRMDDHAQEEIRAYANVIGQEIVGKWCPFAWEAFLDYRRGALQLSRIEIQVLQALGCGDPEKARAIARSAGWLEEGTKGLRPNREREELARKLDLLGIPAPWGIQAPK